MNKILEVNIDSYIREVKIANKIRPKYLKIKPEQAIRLPKKYKKYIKPERKNEPFFNINDLKKNYCFIKDTTKEEYYYLHEYIENGTQRVITNYSEVGKPRFKRINAQDFYAGFSSPHLRNKLVKTIKEYMLPFVNSLPVIERYPLILKLEIFDTIKNYTDKSKSETGKRFDIDNRAYPYVKCFLDLLVTGKIAQEQVMFPILKDDDRLHLTGINILFTPIDNFEDRKLVFTFYEDDREETKKIKTDERNSANTISKEYPF